MNPDASNGGRDAALPILICKSDLPLETRRRNTTQCLGYNANEVELPVVRIPHLPLPTMTGQSTMRDMYGCGHPEPDECLFCSVDKYADMLARRDPFLDANKFKARMTALRNYPFNSVNAAEEGYTYFNSFIEWHRIIATHDFFRQHYATIRNQLTAVRIRYMQLNNRDQDDRYKGMRMHNSSNRLPVTPRELPEELSGAPSIPDKEYCSWIYTPPSTRGDRHQRLSLHYVYAEVPSLTEALRHLELVFAPPPPLYQAIMGAVRRSVSQGTVPGAHQSRHHNSKHRVVQRRSTENQFTVKKKASRRTMALLQNNNKRYVRERQEERQMLNKEEDGRDEANDTRKIRARRVDKEPGIRERFRRGFPVMIFVSDSPILERRLDYHIRQDDRYVNVFHLTTPVTRPPPIGGEWGANAASSTTTTSSSPSYSSSEELSSLSEDTETAQEPPGPLQTSSS